MKKKDYPLSATITAGEAKIGSNLTDENPSWHRRWRKKMKPAIIEILKIVAKQLSTEGVKKVFDFFFLRFRTKSLHRFDTQALNTPPKQGNSKLHSSVILWSIR